jgi:hypothetical protein
MRLHRLTRFAETPHGVFGRFEKWVTVEEENLGNKANVSCIPAGLDYLCQRTTYHTGGYETFEITGVPNRTRILWHVANTEEDVEGCVGPGKSLGIVNRKDEDSGIVIPKLAVLASKDAFADFMAYFAGVDEWTLRVEWYKWAA